MKIIIDMPEYLVNKIRPLIQRGSYSDISSFVLASAENQLLLEDRDRQEPLEKSILRDSMPIGHSHIDLAFIKPNNERQIACLVPPKAEDLISYRRQDHGEDWMWGQINRIFPIKLSLRLLSNLIPEGADRIALKDFWEKTYPLARTFGLYLQKIDAEAKRGRDERLSIGFPVGKNEEKTAARFLGQFIGGINNEGKLYGALPLLRFANLEMQNGESRIGLTKQGLSFARLNNPVLDGGVFDDTLSEQETEFYLSHIKENVPGELAAFQILLKAILGGLRDIEEIGNAIRQSGGIFENWTDNMVSTYRSGAMARMFELNLISKAKEGIRVRYEITSLGRAFLQS